MVSGLRYGDDVSLSTAEDKETYKKRMEEASWITHYEALPNSEVIDLCRKAHVGLLPTFADTYGELNSGAEGVCGQSDRLT